jgi:hypothetical protein
MRVVRQHEWQRPHQGKQKPERHHDNETVAIAQINLEATHRQPAQQSQAEHGAKGFGKWQDYIHAVVPPGHPHRRQHGDTKQHQQHADHVQYGFER